jgi:hypothetical protein
MLFCIVGRFKVGQTKTKRTVTAEAKAIPTE